MKPGDIVSYLEMCTEECVNLQRGMNYHLRGNVSVVLMSLREGAPYADRIEENGRVLVYEGHDISRSREGPDPKAADQPMTNPSGTLTQNGLFYQVAVKHKEGHTAETVRVYEKIRSGIWSYNGLFRLVDAWQELSNTRRVFKFKLEIIDEPNLSAETRDIEQSRLIPSSVKLEVWKRDNGRCVLCASEDNLHFDHIIPYSKGGSSLVAKNIQLLCVRHNLAKRDKIE
ncbi:MAG: YDG/SRA domain-containing protein [Dehalococcoidia bacterium]|nr:YDG/SRA domain-containing protein [Dehalococcoidia bacterium]